MDILFKNAVLITMDDTRQEQVLHNAYVGITGKTIRYIGTAPPAETPARVIDCGGTSVLMPALYNCHTHIPMSLLRGYANDLVLQEWLYEHIFPAEAKLTAEMVHTGAMLSIAEMIASGTVAFTDMYFFSEEVARTVQQTGVKANLTNPILIPSRENADYTKDRSCLETLTLLRHYADDRITPEAGIHAEYTSVGKVWEQVAAFAGENNLGIHLHLSETQREHEECKARYGLTPTEVFARHGVFELPVNAAHCVWLEDADMDILAQKGATAAHCPVSNLKLASGIARTTTMLEKDVNVALGTDGVASNNSTDLFEEVKLASLLQKAATGDPTKVPAWQALRMATVNGAKAQRRPNSGMLREGFDADMILLDFDTPRQTPCYDPLSAAVYSATGQDVCLTMCQGKILYENGEYKTLDIEKILHDANRLKSVFR